MQNQESIYMVFAGREVRIGKNCARGLEYGPRPQVYKKVYLKEEIQFSLILKLSNKLFTFQGDF